MTIPLTALIADDELPLAQFLAARLEKFWPELVQLPLARNGVEALASFEANHPSILFLDIKMPGLSGLEVAQRVAGRDCHIVFVTAYDQFALEAFEHHAVDYLLKPVTDERLERTIAHLQKRVRTRVAPGDLDALFDRLSARLKGSAEASGFLRWLRVSVGEVVRQIPVDEVLYFRAADKYTIIQPTERYAQGEMLIRMSLSELLAQLDPDVFWQIHRGTVVNLNFVEGSRRDVLGKSFVRMRGQATELSVSRHFAHRFKQM